MREVAAPEAELLTQIHAEAFANYWNVGDFNDFFSIGGTRAWLAETESGEAAGMVVLRVQHEQADIITIAVRRAFRRQGIGRHMASQCIDVARKSGATTLFLDVED
ncbi:MAG: GNAT family N-acetyltransferase, partial [Proteobacteria bacterium]|nr:GNAT family N-acetyltransferase [Pseudomonadota bacterium]